MDIPNGERIGAFEILGPIGAGGMGEVYRARDAKLGRDVAVKILPLHLGRNSERLARFQREARVLASLNHPGIGAIYGLEESVHGMLLVLELVRGDTLAERIARGPLPVEEALQIARQIADAVAFAHTNGVVHRDLKPANVKSTPQGIVKVLDFGLAKALSLERDTPGSTDPTVTPITTQDGAILGTPAYMSPEQARAKELDRRTDVWSFGCILFEMLSGRRAFQRATLTDTLVAVLGGEPDWAQLPSTIPPTVRSILRRCLQRDRDRRYHDMADVRIELDEALAPSDSVHAPVSRARARRLQPFEWVCAGVIVLAAITHAMFLYRLVPSLAIMAAGFGVTLSWQLRTYIAASNLSVWIVPILLAGWGLWRLSGRRVAPRFRSAILIVLAVVSIVTTVGGLYLIAADGMVQAMRLVLGAPSQGLQRDLIVLHFAAGDPARVIAILDPKGNRDDFATAVTWASPVQAFQLAEAYRAQGNLVAARRLYTRAKEAAVKFDEVISEQLRTRQVHWQGAFGVNVSEWAPTTADLRQLPDLIKTVSQRRLEQLEGTP